MPSRQAPLPQSSDATSIPPIDYSLAFRERITQMHRGMETRSGYQAYLAAHLGGPDSRVVQFSGQLARELEFYCGPMRRMRVLDMGCGTGSTTVALARCCGSVVAFDVDQESLVTCRMRLAEHGLQERVESMVRGDSIESVSDSLGKFDLVLMNGVIEHIPLSLDGLRRETVRTALELLHHGGHLFINETPNRWFPRDTHTTGLWWLPWSRPGSAWAHQRALSTRSFTPGERTSPGALGLEEEGAWGASYTEILAYLDRDSYEVVNLLPGYRSRVHHTVPGSRKRRVFEHLMQGPVRALRLPLTAFLPYLTNLVLRRR